jgi:hypothetical protein
MTRRCAAKGSREFRNVARTTAPAVRPQSSHVRSFWANGPVDVSNGT